MFDDGPADGHNLTAAETRALPGYAQGHEAAYDGKTLAVALATHGAHGSGFPDDNVRTGFNDAREENYLPTVPAREGADFWLGEDLKAQESADPVCGCIGAHSDACRGLPTPKGA